jgi:PAS domain S-box-containing protein
MFRISRDGTYLDSHSHNESSLYVPRDFFIGKNISEILPPDLAAQSMQAIGKSFSTGEVEHYEYSLSVKDRDRYFENRIIAISDNEVLSIIRDITERKDSETALKMQSAAFESFALTIIITDTAGHIQWVNPAFTKLTGYTVEEAMGKTPGELVSSGQQGDEFYAGFWETLLNKRVWSGEILNRRKDGSLYHEQETITPVLDPQGNVSSYIAIKIDITETKKAQEELLWNKSFLELMSNSSPLGFLVVDNRNDEILYFNKRFCQIWELEQIQDQMERGELKNNDIIPYCLLVLADIPAFAESCTPLQDEENRIIIEDEIPFTENRAVRRFTTQIRGANDEYYGRFYIFEDITDRKRAESDLRKARNEAVSANLAKSEFLSRMSHELRTPMNSILGFAQLLEMGDLNPRQKKGVSHILNSGKHLLELINEVLDISGIEAGRQLITTEPVKLAGIINEVIDSIHVAADKRRVSVTLADSPSNKLFVRADRLRLRQILINLLNNAIKYNKEGGSVVIETKLKRFPEANENRIRISISDTGNGILPEDIGKLFQPFERIGADRTKTEGTGLGLVVVKKLTEAMGGIIGVDSTFGQGSTFWIELATSDQEGTARAENQGESMLDFQVRKGNSTVLYIEDNLSNIELVEQIISEYRPSIRLVKSIFGRQTLELAKECKPDVILLDLNLPDMKGDDILDELMADEDTKSIPVIIISADAMPFHINKLMERGASDYLTKPLDMFQLLRSFDEYIRLE